MPPAQALDLLAFEKSKTQEDLKAKQQEQTQYTADRRSETPG